MNKRDEKRKSTLRLVRLLRLVIITNGLKLQVTIRGYVFVGLGLDDHTIV